MIVGQTVLDARFVLCGKLYSDQYSETWVGIDNKNDQEIDQKCIIRLWPFNADLGEDEEGLNLLWLREERRMRRLAGSAGAQESLLTLVVSGREQPPPPGRWYLAMVLKSSSSGYSPLHQEVFRPTQWINTESLKSVGHRAMLWQGFRRIAAGIHLLHRQRIIHRNVSLHSIYWDPSLPEPSQTMRLGGFESSLRFGMEEATKSPSEMLGTVGFATDWFCFGIALASAFSGIVIDISSTATKQIASAGHALSKLTNSRLSTRERGLIERLLTYGSNDCVVSGNDVVSEFAAVVESLHKGAVTLDRRRPLALLFNPLDQRLYRACEGAGFRPQLNDDNGYMDRDVLRQAQLREFMRQHLRDSRLYRLKDYEENQQCLLVSDALSLLIRSSEPGNGWGKAFVVMPFNLSDGLHLTEDLRGIEIEPVPTKDGAHYNLGQSWKPVVPALESDYTLGIQAGKRIHHFLRSTNLLDLLLTSARIFRYEIVESSIDAQHQQRIIIRTCCHATQYPEWAQPKNGLPGDLNNEFESMKRRSDLVLLTHTGELHVSDVKDMDWWKIQAIDDPEDKNSAVTLVRTQQQGQSPLPIGGFIRTFNLYGLFTLIDRRNRAIETMQDNTQLLRTMELADAEVIQRSADGLNDSGRGSELFERFPTRGAFFEDVDKLRPLYVLQGPPGTGKSTFVAAHLRRLLDKDREPHSQILVTAQAHAGVDVLREKIDKEFNNLGSKERPLSIRLGTFVYDRDSTRNVSVRCLSESLQQLYSTTSELSSVQHRWLHALQSIEGQLEQLREAPSQTPRDDGSTSSLIAGLMQLVRRCANISYSTASAKDLAELAKESDFDNTYDLVIVEEAGKIHAFDLVLPMNAGYNWLLIGDHKQLPAFQMDNFERGIKEMDLAVQALRTLPKSSYIDTAWLSAWEDWSEDEKERQTAFSLSALRYFKWLHEQIAPNGVNATTGSEAKFSGAGRLSDQWRMPDAICQLISGAFYSEAGGLTTGKQDRVPHRLLFKKNQDDCDWSRYPIIWIDTPWCQKDPRFGEVTKQRVNPREAWVIKTLLQGLHAESNGNFELTLAVLSPYRLQRSRLLKTVGENPVPPQGFKFKSSIASRTGDEQWVHTVDSFQGNEADVVIVTLVRNNAGTGSVRETLGFLADAERMNVLLSRSVKQLILVGSWDFFVNQLDAGRVGSEDLNHELWFLRSVVNQLQCFFDNGTALKVPSTDITPVVTL